MNWIGGYLNQQSYRDGLIKAVEQVERLRASLKEYVDYDLLTSDCPNCYMCNEGRADGDTDQCIHQKAVALLAELAPDDGVTEEKP